MVVRNGLQKCRTGELQEVLLEKLFQVVQEVNKIFCSFPQLSHFLEQFFR